MMELKVYNPEDSFLKRIEWNYEELKNYIEPISAEYAASVYTDEMIKKAKEDRAKLNKFKDALEAEKSRAGHVRFQHGQLQLFEQVDG